MMHNYNTVSEATNDLIRRGYSYDFSVHAEEECLICRSTELRLSPDEFEIDETYRFEGMTDPGDEMVVYAISSPKHSVKGIMVNAFGHYADDSAAEIVRYLQQSKSEKL